MGEIYADFIAQKRKRHTPSGFTCDRDWPDLFPHQKPIVRWALRMGKAAIFLDTGLGKTLTQLTWAAEVAARTGGKVILFAPLAVGEQTLAEAARFGIDAGRVGSESPIHVINYDRIHQIDPADYAGVVLDESSILKSVDGRTRTMLIDSFQRTPYRLACTATPAPNDQTELGNHAEFLGICTRTEMLAEFFVHDGGATQDWRLKGHARRLFWEWVASWAVLVKKPSDLGFDDGAYNLPALHVIDHDVQIEAAIPDGMLFAPPAAGLNDQRKARRDHMAPRVQAVADLVASEPDDQWLIWCDLNDESDALAEAIPGAVEVRGSDDNDTKRDRLLGFAAGKVPVLITKTKIAGFGLNWQACARMAFVGPTNSYESWYQAVRRCWRFGQTREVKVFMVKTSLDAIVSENLKEKAEAAKRMGEEMVGFARRVQLESVMGSRPGANTEATQTARIPAWLVTEAS